MRSSWRDVGGEPALQRAELLELADLLLDALGHLVVRLGEPRDVVLADDDHAFVQLTAREPFGGLRGAADRPDDLPGHEVRDAGEQQQQHETADEQRALHDADRGLLGGQRVQHVELHRPCAVPNGAPTMRNVVRPRRPVDRVDLHRELLVLARSAAGCPARRAYGPTLIMPAPSAWSGESLASTGSNVPADELAVSVFGVELVSLFSACVEPVAHGVGRRVDAEQLALRPPGPRRGWPRSPPPPWSPAAGR